MAPFITFEGIEGCGKTTQIKQACEYLSDKGIPFLATAEPGGTPLGLEIRRVLLRKASYDISAEAELFLFLAARVQHVKETIATALEAGKWVLCDRFSDATLVYQGCGRGLAIPFIKETNRFATAGLKPTMTLLFDLPSEAGLGRAFSRIEQQQEAAPEDRFEQEALAFHQRIRDGYLNLAAEEPERFRIIDAAQDIDTVQRQVRLHLSTLINVKGMSHVL